MSTAVSDYTQNKQAIQNFGPSPASTTLLLASLIFLFLFGEGESAYDWAQQAAVGVGAGLAVGFLFELKSGLRNLFRIDVFCLVGLYGLTLAEFLLPQPDFNRMLTADQARQGLVLVYLGFGSLSIGRHFLAMNQEEVPAHLQLPSLSPNLMLLVAFGAFFVGHLYMFLAVGFDPFALFHHLVGPRWGVPWERGRYGTLATLLNELALINYVIPPVVGMAWAKRKEYTSIQLFALSFLFLLAMFIAFSRGTRYVIAIYLATFAISHIFSLSRLKVWYVGIFSAAVMGLFIFGAFHMLEFRNMGLKAYLESESYASEEVRDTLFIDYNLVSIGLLADRFPGEYHFLGFEVAYWAIIKPIPRGLWPGKPKGLSLDIEQALGDEQRTIAATFIGEAYMGGGEIGVVLAGLFFGFLTAWWNRLAAGSQSTLSLLSYATGFFGGIICMRSMFWLTTGILPTIALIFFGKVIYPRFFAGNN